MYNSNVIRSCLNINVYICNIVLKTCDNFSFCVENSLNFNSNKNKCSCFATVAILQALDGSGTAGVYLVVK